MVCYCPRCKSTCLVLSTGYTYTYEETLKHIVIDVSSFYTEYCCVNCDARWRPV